MASPRSPTVHGASILSLPHPLLVFHRALRVTMAFDRKDGNAMFDLPTRFGIAMIEAPWAVSALGLASQSPTPARTSNASPSRRPRLSPRPQGHDGV